jgi:hypothetical protein
MVARVDEHPTEIEVTTMLSGLADLRIDGAHPAKDLVADIVRWLCERSSSLRRGRARD